MKSVMLMVFFLGLSNSFPAENSRQWWEAITPMPDDRMEHATVYNPDSGLYYIIGGSITGIGNDQQNQCWAYNPDSDAWNTGLASMPAARCWIAGAYDNGKIYIPGGFFNSAGTNNFQCYDVAGDTWTDLANLPTNILAYGIAAWNGFIYCVGGNDGAGTWLSSVYGYSIANNQWFTATALPTACGMNAVTQTTNTIFIVGGYDGSNCITNLIQGVIVDSVTINWTQPIALPAPNFNNGCGAFGTVIYSVGGFLNASTPTANCWAYFASSWWQWEDIPDGVRVRNNFAAGGRNLLEQLYIFGGDNSGGWTSCNLAYKFRFPGGITEDFKGSSGSRICLTFTNPVKNNVKITFTLDKKGDCRIELYDAVGRKVETIYAGYLDKGNHSCSIKRPLESGVYFVKLSTVDGSVSSKLIIVR